VINGGNTSAGHETIISGNLELNRTTETCERSKVTQTKAKEELYQKAAIESRALQK
jgi:hypothetical protein